ncbi:MAG TPA: hypothetical protein VE243_02030, partial [Candidatus Acidoferrum sp.]|nr:hypothetical protein [Candidatus Acidoferrum sp.]
MICSPCVVPPFTGIYTLATFKGVPPNPATQNHPDDLAVSADGADLWVGYGNGVSTTGKDPSNLIEYAISSGMVLQNISIPGHLDGLKIDPVTGNVWATVNEDGSPRLNIVNRNTGTFKTFTVSSSLVTGGFDDLVFIPGVEAENVYIVASNASDSTKQVVVQAQITGKKKKSSLSLTSFLAGNPASVFNVVTNTAESGDQIGDPDSMTIDSAGELVLDNRSDDSLYIVRNPTATHPVLRVPLTLAGLPDVPLEVNDTIFTFSETTGQASTAGTLYITDTSANVI